MKDKEREVTVTALANELGIARSTLYYKPKQPEKDEALKKHIQSVLDEHPAYGHRRIAAELCMNKKRVLRVMNMYGIRPRIGRKQPQKPRDQGKEDTIIQNMAKDICPIAPNVLWASDFTYVWFQGQFIFPVTVLDVYDRQIVGVHISTHHTTDLIQQALTDALVKRQAVPQIFHSDQGSEYTSNAFIERLESHGITPSHANKSSPWENGFQESFYSNFKLELGDVNRFDDLGELIEAIHQHIHYYNTKRIHSALNMSPQQYYLNYQLTNSTN